jgi:hypothetical protein
MFADRTIPTWTLATVSLAIGAALMAAPGASAGDLRSQRPMAVSPPAATVAKVGTRATEPKPYVPPRAPGIRPGDQVDFVYEGRPNSYSFGKIVAIMPAGWNLHPPKVGTVHDHRGKTASKPPSTPPGAPPPAAPPPEVSGPPAAPPGIFPTPPAGGGKIVRDHTNEYWPKVTTSKVKDHREGYGGDTYVQKSFTDYMGNTSTVTPRQKPPCFGDACWFFGR